MRFTTSRKSLTACVVASALALTLAAPVSAFAVTSAEKQAEAQAVLASLNTMQAQLDQASDAHYLALEAQQQAQAEADAAQARIDEATGEIADLQSRLGTRAHSMYKEGGSSFLDLILGSTSWAEFTSRWDLLVSINQNDTNLVNETKALRDEIAEQKAVYDEQTKAAAQKAEEAARIEAEAQSTVAAMQATYDSLSSEVAALVEQERAAQEAAQVARADQVVAAAVQSAEAAQAVQLTTSGAIVADTSYDSTSYETMDVTSAQELVNSGQATIVGYDANTGNAIVDRAYAAIGTAYNYGSCSPDAFDCSGFVSYALTGDYNRLGSTTTFMSNYTQVTDPQPGDIAVNEGHCGIYVGDGMMVHAATYGVGVVEGAVQEGMIFVRPN